MAIDHHSINKILFIHKVILSRLLFSAPIAAVGYFFLWYVPDIESMEWRFVYFLAMYLIYQAGVTVSLENFLFFPCALTPRLEQVFLFVRRVLYISVIDKIFYLLLC